VQTLSLETIAKRKDKNTENIHSEHRGILPTWQ